MKKSFKICPVCLSNETKNVKPELAPHPYVGCVSCDLLYQPNPVDKVYEAHHEKRGDLMSDADKAVNRALAKVIYDEWKKLGSAKLGGYNYHLDIGTKYPYLGHSIQNVANEEDKHYFQSYGIDGIDLVGHFGKELEVEVMQADFEAPREEWDLSQLHNDAPFVDNDFSIVTLVHCVEHFYKPIASLKKIHDLCRNNALLFIRCPDSDTQGIERDFTQGHYDIHPLIWNLKSMLMALNVCTREGKVFSLMNTYNFHGQRDYWIRVQK